MVASMACSMTYSGVLIACSTILFSTPLSALPVESNRIFEQVSSLPSSWSYKSPVAGDTPLQFSIALKPENPYLLQKAVYEVSSHTHTNYGKHLSQQEALDLVKPHASATEIVNKWLTSMGIENAETQGHSIRFNSTASLADQVLNANFSRFARDDGLELIRSTQYSLPTLVEQFVDFVYPITLFPSEQRRRSRRPNKTDLMAGILAERAAPAFPEACTNNTNPACLKALYNIDYLPPRNTPSKSEIGIAGFLDQYASYSDTNGFLRKYGPYKDTKYNFTVELVNGGVNPQAANSTGVEATLDLEYVMAFTEPLKVTYYSTAGHGPNLQNNINGYNEPYVEFLQYMLSKKSVPQVLSISYTDSEVTIPIKYAQRVCTMFGQLAARGVSVIIASGDGGVAGTTGDDEDCHPIGNKKTKRFSATFPANCEFVTSVGATTAFPEQGAAFSSGGWSDVFPRPSWQNSVVTQYIKGLNGTNNGFYNKTGRAIPDVSAYGHGFLTKNGPFESTHFGTSASAPVFAAMIGLLNDLRLKQGQPVLGFLNPVLYSKGVASIFNDITDGSSYGCESSWDASKSWDPVTGLGTMDFKRARAALVPSKYQ